MRFDEWRARQERKLDDELEHFAAVSVDAAIEVHRALGPGLPEKAYHDALSYELKLRNVPHACEVPALILYKGKEVGEGRIDILVGNRLVLELKAVDQLTSLLRVWLYQ